MFRRHSAAARRARGMADGAAQPAAAPAASAGEATGVGQPAKGGTVGKAAMAGKGRPTPKRSEAAPRRQPVTAPGNRKQAARQTRERQRTERGRRLEGLKRGDPRYLPAKDRGPVRALARDYVDSRRGIGEYYLFAVPVLFFLYIGVPSAAAKSAVYLLILVTMLVVVLEGVTNGLRVRRLAAQRYPGESTKGVLVYVTLRGAQLRRFRLPAPQVKRGEKI